MEFRHSASATVCHYVPSFYIQNGPIRAEKKVAFQEIWNCKFGILALLQGVTICLVSLVKQLRMIQ